MCKIPAGFRRTPGFNQLLTGFQGPYTSLAGEAVAGVRPSSAWCERLLPFGGRCFRAKRGVPGCNREHKMCADDCPSVGTV